MTSSRTLFLAAFTSLTLVTLLSGTAQAQLYIARDFSNGVARVNLNGTGLNTSFITPGTARLTGVAVDNVNNKIYWSDYGSGLGTGRIGVANLDGTNVNPNFITGLSGTVGLSLDISGGKLYWADDSVFSIRRANTNGTGVTTLFTTGSSHPYDVALDLANSKIYYSSQAGVGRANLDGTGANNTFIASGFISFGLDLDLVNQKVYFGNWTTSIGRANLDGTGLNTSFITGLSGGRDVAVDAAGNRLFWSNGDSVGRSTLAGGSVNQNFLTGLGGSFGLTLVSAAAAPEPGTLALLTIGGTLVLARRRRK